LRKPPPHSSILENARASAARGNAQAARAAYRRALGQSADDVDLLIEFAIFEAGRSRLESAANLLHKARRLRPDDAAIALNLGELARLAGNHESAADEFSRAARLMPDDADAAFGLGEALFSLGRHSDAVAALERAAHLSPRDAEIRLIHGDALWSLGRTEQATDAYRTAVALAPGLKTAWIGLARCLVLLNRPSDAAGAFARADAIEPLDPGSLCLWSRALLTAGRPRHALDVAQRAIAPEPGHAEALHLCGACLQDMGRFDEAEASLRRAFEIAPDRTEAVEALAAMGRARPDDARILEDRLATDVKLSPAARASAHFALYRIHDRNDDRAPAFAALREANAIKAVLEPFDAARHRDIVDAMIAAFDRDFFARLEPVTWAADFTPIFILGLPRSGTTLAEQILAHYVDVHAGGERIPFRDVLGEALDEPRRIAARNCDWADRNTRLIAERLAQGRSDERYVTDKTPGNYMAVPFIAWMFPRARIIHCRRNPRDTGFSCFEQNFRAGVSFAYRLDAFACAYRSYDDIMRHWHACGGPEMFDLQYESLVSDPDTVGRQLASYCGLDWDPACLDTTTRRNAVQSASFWQVRQPINTRSIGKWRRYERELAELLDMLPHADSR
jgi:tetratricopeptide (TPR) repeat protein